MTFNRDKPKIYPQKEPDPAPSPVVVEEMAMAGDIVRKKARKKGRMGTRLAGRMMDQRNQILKTKVGE